MEPRVGGQVVCNGQEDLNGIFLKDGADGFSNAEGVVCDIKATYFGQAARGIDQGRQDPEEGGLPGPISAQKAENLPFFDLETESIQGTDVVVGPRMVDLDEVPHPDRYGVT